MASENSPFVYKMTWLTKTYGGYQREETQTYTNLTNLKLAVKARQNQGEVILRIEQGLVQWSDPGLEAIGELLGVDIS